jgi:DNA-binding transcriptional LysR family regulator
MDLYGSMSVFVQIVEKGSLTAAASASGISPTMVGNHLHALEKRLGMSLVNRTTRRQNLTDFGKVYYERCLEILRLVAELEALEVRHGGLTTKDVERGPTVSPLVRQLVLRAPTPRIGRPRPAYARHRLD